MTVRTVALATAVAAAGLVGATTAPASAATWNGPETVTFKDSWYGITFNVHTRQAHYVSDRYGTHVDYVYARSHRCDFLDWASYNPGEQYSGAHYGWCN